MKAVFALTKGSSYGDDPYSTYPFPENAGNRQIATNAVGDWIVYYQSGTDRKKDEYPTSYVGCARVRSVEPRSIPHTNIRYIAHVHDYVEFERPVFFKGATGRYRETAANKTHTMLRKSLRPLSDADFTEIVRAGLGDLLDPAAERKHDIDRLDEEDRSLFYGGPGSVDRPIETILVNKKVRDRNFQKNVRAAYRNRCAVTRFDLTNGGGRPEVQACHIRPVENDGPDVVQNGVALSGTVHWMFDRGLISFSKDRKLLVSHNQMPTHLRNVLDTYKDDPWFPPEPHLRPREDFLEWHRDEKFGRHETLPI